MELKEKKCKDCGCAEDEHDFEVVREEEGVVLTQCKNCGCMRVEVK